MKQRMVKRCRAAGAEPINIAAPGHFFAIDEPAYQGLQGFTADILLQAVTCAGAE